MDNTNYVYFYSSNIRLWGRIEERFNKKNMQEVKPAAYLGNEREERCLCQFSLIQNRLRKMADGGGLWIGIANSYSLPIYTFDFSI